MPGAHRDQVVPERASGSMRADDKDWTMRILHHKRDKPLNSTKPQLILDWRGDVIWLHET